MALFKIFKGNQTNKLTDSTVEGYRIPIDGYAYYDTSTRKFYIDADYDNNGTITRQPINAYYADGADAAKLAIAAEKDDEGNEIKSFYAHLLDWNETTGILQLKNAHGTPIVNSNVNINTIQNAKKLTTNDGNFLNPVYFSNGIPVASEGYAIPVVEGLSTDINATTSDTTAKWTGVLEGLTEYYNGLTIIYIPKIENSSATKATTLNLNNLGAKTCYFSNKSALTTHYSIETPILFTYYNDAWRRADYNTNTNTLLRTYASSSANELPLVGVSNSTSMGIPSHTSSYKDLYGGFPATKDKRPTVQLSTGKIKVPGGIEGNVTGNVTGNATTATNFASAKTITLTGNVTGTASGGNEGNGWSITTTIPKLTITNEMLAGSIANIKLINSKINIAGSDVSLGGSLTASTLKSNLGLDSAMHFIGISSTEITNGGNENPTISGYSTKTAGDVVLYGNQEFVYTTTNKWVLLGDESSYKIKQTAVADSNATTVTGENDTFVTSVIQNANGVISVNKQLVKNEIYLVNVTLSSLTRGTSDKSSVQIASALQAGKLPVVKAEYARMQMMAQLSNLFYDETENTYYATFEYNDQLLDRTSLNGYVTKATMLIVGTSVIVQPHSGAYLTDQELPEFLDNAGYLTSFTETDPTVPAWAKAATKPSYNLGEITQATDIQAIEALTGTSGFLKKISANTWSLDTNTYVTGVKGDAETNYRTDKVNITAANIGLGNVENTALSTWTGSTNITTIGTLSSGTVPWARLSGVPNGATKEGTVTSLTIKTTSPITGGSDTATTTTGNYTIALTDAYGDTKNPYSSKTKNYVLAAPSGEAGAPSFRKLVAADIPSLNASKITAGQFANERLANSKVTIAGNDVSLGGSLTSDTLRESLGLSNAMHFIGVTQVEITDGSTTNPQITGYSTKTAGDVILYNDAEFVWTGDNDNGHWELLGDANSFKVKQTIVTAPATETNKWISSIGQDANGLISANYTSLDTSGAWSGNAGSATKLAEAKTIQTNLASTSSASFDGSADITPGVTGILPVANGGTGVSSFTANRVIMSGTSTTANLTTRAVTNNTSNTAATASTNIPTMNTLFYTLAQINNANQTHATNVYAPTTAGTANQILVSAGGTLAPTWKATGNGAAYATSTNGALTFGTLPIAQGGTGKTNAADAWTNLGGGASGKHAEDYYVNRSGDTMTGSLTIGSLTDTVEQSINVSSGAGRIALYSHASSDGYRGIYAPLPTSPETGISLISVDKNNTVGYASGYVSKWRITSANDVSGTSAPGTSAPLVIGPEGGDHLEIDANEILAKSDGTTPSTLYLQDTTGTVEVCGSGGLYASNGLLKTYCNGNLLTIGSQNNAYCHFYSQYNPFYFNRNIEVDGSVMQYPNSIVSMPFINGRDTAAVKVPTYNNYHAGLSMKTTNGSWEIGVYTSNNLWFTYVPDTQYSSQQNSGYFQTHISADGKVWGAVYNDYAEMRNVPEAQNEDNPLKPGTCVREVGDGTMVPTTERLQRGCKIISDTFGFNIGETEDCKTPIAVSGRALVYLDQDRENARNYIGWPVCSGPDGTISIMTEEEEEKYPSRIVGTISEIPNYEKWGSSNVEVDGRIWIYVK